MPHEFSATPYNLVKQPRPPKHMRPTGDMTSPELPKPDMNKPESLAPKNLLQHENQFDKNIFTPEQYGAKPGVFSGRSEELTKA